jgi:hypothetical protein
MVVVEMVCTEHLSALEGVSGSDVSFRRRFVVDSNSALYPGS